MRKHQAGFTLIELVISIILVAITGIAASGLLISYYQQKQVAITLSNVIAGTATVEDALQHTIAKDGYNYCSVINTGSSQPCPIGGSALVNCPSGVTCPNIANGGKSYTAYWYPTVIVNGIASPTAYCQGVLSVVPSTLSFGASSPGGLLWTVTAQGQQTPANCEVGQAFYPIGDGWAFSVIPGTQCSNDGVPHNTIVLTKTMPALGSAAKTTSTQQMAVPVCLINR